MTQDFARLGAQLKAARTRMRPRISQDKAAERLGVSRSTIQKIENGEAENTTVTTVRAFVHFVGWTGDSYERVLGGGEPLMRGERDTEDKQQPGPQAQTPEGGLQNLGLAPTVEYELLSGRTLESTVFNLGPDEDDGHLIVVVQGRKDATPEEVQKVAARFQRVRRHLQSIAADSDEVAGE